MNPKLLKFIKEIQFHSPLRRYFFPRYTFSFTPQQLNFLCQCIDETKDVKGAICEIGCAAGNTTVFLNKFMNVQIIEKEYFALDTFSGFVQEDIDFEVTNRGKRKDIFSGFTVNNIKWFDGTMQQNKVTRVKSIKADVNEYDLTKIGPLSFSLLDVDLYRPMKKALPELYQVLSPGGIIVIDDCDPTNSRWDGSDQAYKEFMKEIGQEPEIVLNKLGVIKKPA